MSDNYNWSDASRDAQAIRLEQEVERVSGKGKPASDSATDLVSAAASDPEIEHDLTEAPAAGSPERNARQHNEVNEVTPLKDHVVGEVKDGQLQRLEAPLVSSTSQIEDAKILKERLESEVAGLSIDPRVRTVVGSMKEIHSAASSAPEALANPLSNDGAKFVYKVAEAALTVAKERQKNQPEVADDHNGQGPPTR